MCSRTAILDMRRRGSRETVGGIPLAARNLYHLEKLDIQDVLLVSDGSQSPGALGRWTGKARISWIGPEEHWETIEKHLSTLPAPTFPVLYIDSAHLVDPRLIRSLAHAGEPTLAFLDPSDEAKGSIRAGLLGLEELELLWKRRHLALRAQCAPLLPDDLDPYNPEIRGELTPYFLEVTSPAEAMEATRLLIRSQQKHVMDLPAEFIDPPFENALTLLLCDTTVTPNMVTFAGVAIAALVSWLFWHGHFLAGALLTFPVEILDGVDGKLARTKLQYSRLGQHEAVIDYLYENSWYICLGVGLSSVHATNLPYFWASLLVLSDTIDNVLYTLADRWFGKSIDLFSPFDAAFRRIAGRRNIYCALFIFGFLLGCPLGTFAVASVWAVVTVVVHGIRLARHDDDGEALP